MKFRINYYLQFSVIVMLIFISHSNEEHFKKELLENFGLLKIFIFSTFMSLSVDFIYQKWLNSQSKIKNDLKLILFVSIFVGIILILVKYLEYHSEPQFQALYQGYFAFIEDTGAWNDFFQEQITNNSFAFLGYHYFYFLDRQKKKAKALEEKKLDIERVKELNKESYLLSLQNQVNPHFLFNSLNSVAGLIHDDPNKAVIMSNYLQSFFKLVHKHSSDSYSSIKEEIELIKFYLKIEGIRFENRLETHFLVDPTSFECKIPRLLLQPLVENAIKHGISPYQKKGFIKVSISRKNDNKIEILIHDSGTTFKEGNEGYGLKNVRKRLEYYYYKRSSLNILDSETGTIVRINIPI
jgi:signal transduction histidine kinase